MDQAEDGKMEIAALAATAVGLLGTKAFEAIGGEAGKRLVGDVWDAVKAKLTRPAATEAIEDFVDKPEDENRRRALVRQVEKALEADPAFREELAKLVEAIPKKDRAAIQQIANFTGDRNITVQSAGAGNQVSVDRR
jgi:hypothetical protein